MKIHAQRLLRIRMRFVVLGVLLLGLFFFLLFRVQAQEDVLAQQEHEALAERFFDELEGELLRFLEVEESKGVDVWSRYTEQQPVEPFVLSYFQVSPDEQVSSNPSLDAPYVSRASVEPVIEQKMAPIQNSVPQDTRSAQKMLNRSSKVRYKVSSKKNPFQSFTEREKIVLFREVVDGNGSKKQGLILDTKILQQTISERVLADIRPTEYSRFGSREQIEWASLYWERHEGNGINYVFRHLFSPPFAQLHVEAHIKPLSLGMDRWLSVSFFGGISMLVVGVGLWSLYRMQLATEETARLRSDFVGAVSHELRTPITAIQLYAEMLSEGMVSEKKKKQYYETIDAEANRLAVLVEDILSFSKLDLGQQEALSSDGVFSEVIEALEKRFLMRLEQEEFVFVLDASQETEDFPVAVEPCIQVLSNLIDNARKFSQGYSLEISIVMKCEAEKLRVCVLDRGPGIPTEQIGLVRSPFVRGEDEQTRKTKGTGIGLALVEGLMNAMGGEFILRNREGGGVCAECIWIRS